MSIAIDRPSRPAVLTRARTVAEVERCVALAHRRLDQRPEEYPSRAVVRAWLRVAWDHFEPGMSCLDGRPL